jgi:tetratricopeptide (TPR) repeat protein
MLENWLQEGPITLDATVMLAGKLDRTSKAWDPEPAVIPIEQKIAINGRIGEQYEVRRILGGEGKSGMGVVYVCYDHSGHQLYALKTFQDKYLYSDRIKDNFKREALAWVMLDSHPNIVQAVCVESIDDRLFIVLDYVEPDSLGRNTMAHYLKTPISYLQALEWSIQFCDGMAYAASQGVTPHRDIKPDNIMVTRVGNLKITDFGLASLWKGTWLSEEPDCSPARAVAGTAPWMAPEQFHGHSDLRSDIYSFGVVLYQMASGGKLPFTADSLEEYHKAHLDGHVPRVPGKLFPVIKKCLNKSPGKRYDDFCSLRADLERLYRAHAGYDLPAPPGVAEPGLEEYNNRGLALFHMGLVDNAIMVYGKALLASGHNNARMAVVHNNLGVAFDARGQPDRAIEEYRAAVALSPELADAHNNMGAAYRARGMIDEAISEYGEALRLKPSYAMAWYNRGLSFAYKGDLDGAIDEYCTAIGIKPGFVDAWANLGLAHAMKGMLDLAIIEYRKAACLRPGDAAIRLKLANAFRSNGQADEAIGEYRTALELGKNRG